jgi:hypothetical protein
MDESREIYSIIWMNREKIEKCTTTGGSVNREMSDKTRNE